MRLLLVLLLLLLLLLFRLVALTGLAAEVNRLPLALLFREFDERLVLEFLAAPNKLSLPGAFWELATSVAVCELLSITCTKLDGKTPILPLDFPFHQPASYMFVGLLEAKMERIGEGGPGARK